MEESYNDNGINPDLEKYYEEEEKRLIALREKLKNGHIEPE